MAVKTIIRVITMASCNMDLATEDEQDRVNSFINL